MPAPPPQPVPPILVPLAVWIVPQLIALAVSAGQIPLSANFVRPAERAAVDAMLSVQFASMALLLPIVLRSVGTTTCAIVTSWIYLLLAGFLATAPIWSAVWGALHLSAWLVGLGSISRLLTTDRARAVAAAIASLLVLGPVVLLYLRMEYQPGAPAAPLTYTPLLGALAQARSEHLATVPLAFAGVLSVIGVIGYAAQRRGLGFADPVGTVDAGTTGNVPASTRPQG